MNRTLIQQHTSTLIKNLIAEANALKDLKQTTLKGQLRELLTSKIFDKFLTSQFGTGSGVIINQKGEQSAEMDIIIYDRRILPPFIEKRKKGVYPAECVLAVIQVRSWVSKTTIREYADLAKKFYEKIYHPHSVLRWYRPMLERGGWLPLYSLIGFKHRGIFRREKNREEIITWMADNAKPLFGVCIINKLSWLDVMKKTKGRGSLALINESNNKETNEETKAFIMVLLDNIRTLSQIRYLTLIQHADWLGIYTRDQTGLGKYFE